MFSPLHPDPVAAGPLRVAAGLLAAPARALAGARGALFPLVPVALGLGVGCYFALPAEPGGAMLGMVAVALALLVPLALLGPEGWRPLAIAVALVLAGLLLAALRSHAVAAPVLGWHRHGPVEGRIIGVDRSATDAVRLTLDRLVLPGVAPERVPERVRVSIHGPLDVDPIPGTRVMLTGHLGPPPGPVEPGGFDFRRMAWFERLGALGYTRTPVLAIEDPEPGAALWLTRLRLAIAAGIRARLPGESGGFVAAILIGDRSGIGQATTEALRQSSLYHMGSISGLHMGLLTGVVYGALRALLALVPLLALRLPLKKLAALGALIAAAVYLALSGGDPATERSFIMAAAMLTAVMLGRRALTMRSVALAALVLLMLEPEVLLNAGFQLSFAATIALVAAFRRLADLRRAGPRRRPTRLGRLAEPVLGAALSSLIAGLATAPLAGALFHRYAEYGLLANTLGVPIMSILVMPAAVLAAVLWPVGLEGAGLWLMDLGARAILHLAAWIAGLEGATRMVVAPPWWVIPEMALGALWLILWPGRARLAGAVAVTTALAGWSLAERPALLIDREGALVGLLGSDGRALSRARGAGYAATAWLEADGDAASQADAAARPGFTTVEGGVQFLLGGQVWLHLTGERGVAALPYHCLAGRRIILNREARAPPGGCDLLDSRALAQSGALAVSLAGAITSARSVAGARPWTGE